jgi:hypothetical protein
MGRKVRKKNRRREEYNIRYNSIIYNITPARKINTHPTSHLNHPPEPNTTQIKLHHSRHPSDNLCGVKLEKMSLEYK